MSSKPVCINKWHTLAACAGLQLSAGLAYTFCIFSSDLKNFFGWSQTELAGFSTALNVGTFTAFIPGGVYQLLGKHHRWGPRICLAIAACLGFLGMFLIWGTTQLQFGLSYNALCVAAFIFTNSNAFIDTTCVTCNVTNWPNDRGSAVGVMKAAVGLSGGVYASVYTLLFRPDVSDYLLMMMIVPAVSCVLALPFVNVVPWVQKCELVPHGLLSTASRFLMAYQVLIQIALFNIVTAIACQYTPSPVLRVVLTCTLAALVVALFLPTIATGGLLSREAHLFMDPEVQARLSAVHTWVPESVLTHSSRATTCAGGVADGGGGGHQGQLLCEGAAQGDVAAVGGDNGVDGCPEAPEVPGAGTLAEPLLASAAGSQPPTPPHPARPSSRDGSDAGRSDTSAASELYHEQVVVDVTPWSILLSIDFYLLQFTCFVGMGAGLGLLDNLPQLLSALAPPGSGVPEQLAPNLATAFSVANTLGRISAGYVSELALHARGTPRTSFLTGTAAISLLWCGCAFGLTLCAGSAWTGFALYPIAFAAGLAFGAQWTLMATVVSELFGLKNFAANYAAMQSAPMYASYIFPTYIVGALFDRAARAQNPDSDARDLDCVGPSCFDTAFGIVFGLTSLQLLAALVLWGRTTWIYERMSQHLKEVEQIIIEEGAPAAGHPCSHQLDVRNGARRARQGQNEL